MGELLIANFWLICGLWTGAFGSLFFHYRLDGAVASGKLDASSRTKFVRGWFFAIIGPCVLFWLLQLSSGSAATPEFVKWPNPQKWAAIGVNVSCWGLLLYWVWFANGAGFMSSMLSHASRGGQRFPFGAAGIKALSVLMVISGSWALFVSIR